MNITSKYLKCTIELLVQQRMLIKKMFFLKTTSVSKATTLHGPACTIGRLRHILMSALDF